MSRIGKAPIAIPAGVTVEVKDHVVTVKGKIGSLQQTINPDINVEVKTATFTLPVPATTVSTAHSTVSTALSSTTW